VPDLIFCGRMMGTADLVELAQAIRSVWAEPPMYFVTTERDGFDQQAFAKNGFSDAFLLPMDGGVLRGLLPDGAADYREVPLIDLKADTVLGFDTYIYLPLNRKFIRFSSAGYPLSEDRAKRLLEHEVRIVYVAQEQLPAYAKFTATQLKNISDNTGATPAERKKQMQTAVRALLTGFLAENADPGDYSEIIKTYILETSGETDSFYERMLKLTGSGDAYSHVSNVSSLASMFSLGLGIGKVEEIALAGLLHDIGLADVAPENMEKSDEERSESERLAYQKHPETALQIIKRRQIELNTRVLKIIEQHHERWDARGYPAELRENAILPESQLLAIADELEYATQVKPGKTRVSLREAAEKILKSPGFDPELLKKLAELLGMPA
jgi:putative nucleotidyltransferase with HDIG domain